MPSAPYDYTEGANENDLQSAYNARVWERRLSQSSLHDALDDEAIYDGPGHSALPSSVTTMHRERKTIRRIRSGRLSFSSHRRRRSENSVNEQRTSRSFRRASHDSQRSIDEHAFQSDDEDDGSHEIDMTDIAGSHVRSLHRQESTSRSVFENVTRFFRQASPVRSLSPARPHSRMSSRSRLSRSHVGSLYDDDNETEQWGYSSHEESPSEQDELLHEDADLGTPNTEAFGSLPPSPTGSLPFLSADPLFGDTRIEIEDSPPRADSPTPLGPPHRQQIHLTEEDITIRLIGYEVISSRQLIWRASCVLTLGMLSLAGHWFPRFWLHWVARKAAFGQIQNGFIVIEMPSHDIVLVPLKKVEYPYPITTVFPDLKVTTPCVEDLPSAIPSPMASEQNNKRVNNENTATSTLTVIDYRYTRYILNPETGLFVTNKDWRDNKWKSVVEVQNGLNTPTRSQRSALFGLNLIDIQSKSTVSLLIDEIIHPFYVFQIASIILWSIDDYYYYAFCIALISIVSITTTLIETKKTITRMRNLAKFSCTVGVLVDGSFEERNSADLIPGDVISLRNSELTVVPADLILLSGDAIVNESMLTGESVPISKSPVDDAQLNHWRDTGEISGQFSKGFMYSGTRIIRIRGTLHGIRDLPATALVVRIGFNTTKGALIRSMLFPKPMGFKFYRDSMRFIGVLALLAILGFLTSAVQFIRLHVPWQTILIRALDLITVVVPPALPATLSIGTSFAIGRLRRLGIFCISPSRVNVAGKINVVCFDKTGTLTEDGLDVLGVRCIERSGDLFGDLLSDVHDLPLASGSVSFLHALATCHSLKVIDGRVMGDPLEVKMFEFTNWMLEEGHIGIGKAKSRSTSGGDRPVALVQMIVRPPGGGKFRLEDALKAGTKHAHFLELGVIRMFEFVPALRRMSVIVKRFKGTSMEVYVKGAPDTMNEICEKSSFPRDYDDLLSYYTNRGFRVIAIAGKRIEGLTWLKAQRMKREQAETGLQFLGLIIFENKIKSATVPAITTLRAAHLGCRMVTGDNIRTAISVARECGMVSQSAHVFCPSFVVGNASTRNAKVEWSSGDDDSLKLDPYSLRPLPVPPHLGAPEIAYPDYALALNGDVFRWIINYAALETLQRMLVKAQVFARMSPDEKHELVERLQSLGYVVAFCGDGANDCGALKAADVGLSLSEAEASVAAPFTSRTQDIGCMIDVIKEGRAALVTSFSCFKYMALYSLIQFTSITLLYSFASRLGDFQFLYIDLFIIIPIAVNMGRTLPYSSIHPKRPTASLVSKRVLTSIIGQVLINSGVQLGIFIWVRSRSWYRPPQAPSDTDEDLSITNYENTTLFYVSLFQYILVAAVFSIGPPYREPMWRNRLLMICLATLSGLSALLLLAPPAVFSSLLELIDIPTDARLELLAVVLINVGLSAGFERWCQEIISDFIGGLIRLLRRRRGRRVNGKVYKAVESVY